MDEETIFTILILLLTIVGVYIFYKIYVMLLVKVMVRRHKKRLSKGTMTNQKLIKMYNRFKRDPDHPKYTMMGPDMTRMLKGIQKLYRDEMMKRNLL